MDLTQRHIPVKLEQQFEGIAQQYLRRERLRGWLKFGCAFLVLLFILGGMLKALDDWPVPPMIPVLGFGLLLALLWWQWLYRPTRQKPSREQLALFLDEHHPELENLAISSVEFSQQGYEGAPDWMLERFFQDARLKTQALTLKSLMDGVQLDRLSIGVACVWLLGLVVLGGVLMRLDLAQIREGFFVWGAYGPAPFEVSPGNTRLRKGEDLVVWVTSDAADENKAIRWRTGSGNWQTGVLQASSSAKVYYIRLDDLQIDTDYQVQVGRRRSEVFRATVWEPPEVDAIHLTYHFPEYLNMSSREVPNGGHITVPEGATVGLEVEVNKPLSKAALVLANGAPVDLQEASAWVWKGQIVVLENNTYHIELKDLDGAPSEYHPTYTIVAQDDKAPEIRIRFPRGDDEATSLEEILFGFAARDDYGLQGYGLQYEVAGRDPVRIDLSQSQNDTTGVEVDHLVALEGLDLSGGDFLTWTVWAEDRKPDRAVFETLGDPYFLEIRPFHHSFSEALSNQGGQQGQRGGQQRQGAGQKQVIIATWNLRKEARTLDEEEYDERLTAVIGAQQEVLVTALEGNPPAEIQRKLVEEIEGSIVSLGSAELPEPEASLSEAMRHQQRAYGYLLRLVPDRTQVMQGRGAQMSSGRGSAQDRDMDLLDMTRRRDFREEATTLREQQAETEAVRSQIAELAKRQGLINEDVARLISEMEQMEAEELKAAKRRLEQLREEQQRAMAELDRLSGEIAAGDLDARQARQAQRQLEDARRQMNRSAEGLSENRLQRARAAGNRALGALHEAEEELQNLSRQAATQRMAELQKQMEQMQERQTDIVDGVREQQEEGRTAQQLKQLDSGEGQGPGDMLQEKRELTEQFKAMMEDASELAEKSEETQGRMARELGDWLRETAREGVYEDIQKGERYLRYGAWDVALDHEEGVGAKLEEVARQLDQVAGHLVNDDLDGMKRALDELEDLRVSQSGERQSGEGGEGGEDGRDRGNGSGEEVGQEGRRRGGPGNSGVEGPSAGGGDGAFGWGPRSAEELRRFAAGGYREWLDRIRNAEDLLPEENPVRQRLGSIREDLDAMRRRFGRDSRAPQFDLVFDQAVKPLTLAAEELKRSIQEKESEFVFGPESEGEVPAQYKAQVAEYFKALSEMK